MTDDATTTTELVVPKDHAALVNVDAILEEIEKRAMAIAIVDKASADAALSFLTRLATAKKQAEAARVAIVGPPNTFIREVNLFWRTKMDKVDVADKALRKKITEWQKGEETRQRQEHAAALEKRNDVGEVAAAAAVAALPATASDDIRELEGMIAAANAQATVAVPDPPKRTMTSAAGTSQLRKVWKWELEDIDLVPSGFLVVDAGAVKRAIDAGVHAIPGLRIYQDDVLAVRS